MPGVRQAMKEVAGFTVSTFGGLPLSLHLAERLFAPQNITKTIVLHHCQIRDFRPGADVVVTKPLEVFPDFARFIEQSAYFKVKKHFAIIWRLVAFCARTRHPVVYTVDSSTAALALLLKKFVPRRRIEVIYHQFEMDLPEQKTGPARFLFRVFRILCGDLALLVVPEQNRLDYLREQLTPATPRSMVVPNTTGSKPRLEFEAGRRKVVFGHVGALGTNHYAETLLSALSQFEFDWELLLVGRVTSEVRAMIDRLGLCQVTLVSQVPHGELEQFYGKMDFGLILYRAVDLNTQFCAPNKLYEMWAYGIPVIGPPLAGLQPLFHEPALGRLIDMETTASVVAGLRDCVRARDSFDRGTIAEYFDKNLSLERYVSELDATLAKL